MRGKTGQNKAFVAQSEQRNRTSSGTAPADLFCSTGVEAGQATSKRIISEQSTTWQKEDADKNKDKKGKKLATYAKGVRSATEKMLTASLKALIDSSVTVHIIMEVLEIPGKLIHRAPELEQLVTARSR